MMGTLSKKKKKKCSNGKNFILYLVKDSNLLSIIKWLFDLFFFFLNTIFSNFHFFFLWKKSLPYQDTNNCFTFFSRNINAWYLLTIILAVFFFIFFFIQNRNSTLTSGDLNPSPYPHTPQTIILVEWPSHKGCAVVLAVLLI